MSDLPRLVQRTVDRDGTRRIAFLRGPYRFEFEVGEETFTAMGDSENEQLRAERDALRAEVERLREALEEIVEWDEDAGYHAVEVARAALRTGEPDG